jgi:hypothetical protein
MYKSAVCVKACPTATSSTAPDCFPIAKSATMNAIGCGSQSYQSEQVFSICVPAPSAFKPGTPGALATAEL